MFLILSVCSFLAAGSNAQQGCGSITQDDLGSTSASSLQGLVAENVGTAVQLLRFRIACEVTGGSRDTYSQTSVVVEFMSEGTVMRAQMEFVCMSSQWTSDAITMPPDIDNILFTVARRDCHQCVSPITFESSAPGNNHCLGTYACRVINELFVLCKIMKLGACRRVGRNGWIWPCLLESRDEAKKVWSLKARQIK